MRLVFLLLLCCVSALHAQTFAELVERWESHQPPGHNDAWGIWTNLAEYHEKEFLTTFIADLDRISPQQLDPADRINHRLLRFIADDRLFRLSFADHHFSLDSEGGFLAGIVYTIYGRRVTTDDQLAGYHELLRRLPRFLRWQEILLRQGAAAGRQSPQLIVDNCVKQIDRLLELPAYETMFMAVVAGNEDYTAKTLPLVQDSVYAAYRNIRTYLAGEYRATAPEAIGISEIKDGKRYYEQRVRYYTTYDATPQEVFDTGRREVARIRAEMEAIITGLNFEGSFADFLNFLRTDPQFYASSPEELLKEAAWITKRMEAKLPAYFNHLPRMPLAVEPVPAALAPNYTGGRYSPGSYAGHRAGEFWVNTYDLPSRPLYVLPALALHEGAPGHHTQMMLAAELEGQPDFRAGLYLSAFGEGWGLYAEYLGREAGIYRTPYEEFGRLTYEMWRACRLVVDPGMHYFGWDRDRAVAFLRENTALSLHEVNTEIDRYIGWPAQAVSYKMGELRIRALRARAEKKLGDRFDIRAFHDLVLSNGAVTLDLLEEMVDAYIKKAKKQGGNAGAGKR